MLDSDLLTFTLKLKDPSFVKREMLDPTQKNPHPLAPYPGWSDLSLAHGYPSLLLYFAIVQNKYAHSVDLEGVIHNYVLKIKEVIEGEGVDDYSLFSGLCGVCFSLEQASFDGIRYQRMLSTLQNRLISETKERYFKAIQACLDSGKPIPSYLYDPISGITGIGRYALFHLSQPQFLELAVEIVKLLINISHLRVIANNLVPGWYLSPDDPINIYQTPYPKGSFNTGLAHGITAVLAFLSIAFLKGIHVEGQEEAIRCIVKWLAQKAYSTPTGTQWPSMVSWDEELNRLPSFHKVEKDAWCYGAPGIARALFLAGKALKDDTVKNFATTAFEMVFSRTEQEWNLPGPTLCHGIGGLLLVTNEMAKDPECKKLQSHVDTLKSILLTFYDPHAPYGFQDVEVSSQGGFAKVNKVGLLDGVVGIFLTLLTLRDSQSNWHMPFLLND